MSTFFTTKRLCRAGVIAALYAVFTYAFAPFAFGPLQVRPAEALCILPLLFPEAIPALFVGCALSNLTSPYLFYDILFGSLTTLLAAFISYTVGRFLKKERGQVFFGGLAPVLLNALVLPFLLVFLCGEQGGYSSAWNAYFVFFASILLTQSVWVYALGAPLYFALNRLKKTSRFLGE